MTDLNALSQIPEAYSLDDGGALIARARKLGMSDVLIKQVAYDEQSNHGLSSSAAFKYTNVGVAGLIVFSLTAIAMTAYGNYAQAFVFLFFTCVSVWLFRYGKQEHINVGFAAAVLREKTLNMTVEQISVLKDTPGWHASRDTIYFLSKIQERKHKSSSEAALGV